MRLSHGGDHKIVVVKGPSVTPGIGLPIEIGGFGAVSTGLGAVRGFSSEGQLTQSNGSGKRHANSHPIQTFRCERSVKKAAVLFLILHGYQAEPTFVYCRHLHSAPHHCEARMLDIDWHS